MNGPEHYAKAEQLLDNTVSDAIGDDDFDTIHALLANAQVHATLALVAAIADIRVQPIIASDGTGVLYGTSSLREDTDHNPKPGTWANVIRSTIGDQE